MNRQLILNSRILEAHSNYLIKFNKLWNFLIFNKSLLIQNKIIENNENISSLIVNIKPNLLNDIKTIEDEFDASNKNIDSYYDELMFKSNYQFFEEFLFDFFYSLYNTYPIFLKKIDLNIDFKLIFEENNIENLRSHIIEKKVKTLIQSNNIINILKQVKTIFGLDLKFDNETLNQLYTLSKIRNILTHNNGVINDIFLDDLKIYNIEHEYFKGQIINEQLNKESKLLVQITEKVVKHIINKIELNTEQIEKYSFSLI